MWSVWFRSVWRIFSAGPNFSVLSSSWSSHAGLAFVYPFASGVNPYVLYRPRHRRLTSDAPKRYTSAISHGCENGRAAQDQGDPHPRHGGAEAEPGQDREESGPRPQLVDVERCTACRSRVATTAGWEGCMTTRISSQTQTHDLVNVQRRVRNYPGLHVIHLAQACLRHARCS